MHQAQMGGGCSGQGINPSNGGITASLLVVLSWQGLQRGFRSTLKLLCSAHPVTSHRSIHCALVNNIVIVYKCCDNYVYYAYSQQNTIWPMWGCLGNHSNAARCSPFGKRFIGCIVISDKMESETVEEYRHFTTTLYLEYWKAVAQHIAFWLDGFALKLLGNTEMSRIIIVPGVHTGDLVEMRIFAGTSSAWSIRCMHKLGVDDGEDDSSTATIATSSIDPGPVTGAHSAAFRRQLQSDPAADSESDAESDGDPAPESEDDGFDASDGADVTVTPEVLQPYGVPARKTTPKPVSTSSHITPSVCIFTLTVDIIYSLYTMHLNSSCTCLEFAWLWP
jgi:hypothetical protein